MKIWTEAGIILTGMDKERALLIIDQIVREKNFSRLDNFEPPTSWEKLSSKERELLAILFIWRADSWLLEGRESVRSSLDIADKIAPNSARAHYWQGMFWLRLGANREDPKDFEEASDRFKRAVAIDASLFLAWCGWGITLTKLGTITEDLSSFTEADEKFQRAADCLLDEQEQAGELYWDWAECWRRSGEASGEAIDFHTAIDKFQRAAGLGQTNGAFWLAFGHTFRSLAELVGEPALLGKALGCYLHAVCIAREDSTAWLAVGKTVKALYEIGGDEADFVRAHEAFEAAAQLDTRSSEIWLEWAALLLTGGERQQEARLVELALEKLEKGLNCASTTLEGVLLSVQGLSQLGAITDRYDYLQQAYQRAEEALRVFPEAPELHCCMGDTLMCMGDYFDEPSHWRKATEKYAAALALDSSSVPAHFGLAKAAVALGSVQLEVAFFEQAARHLGRVVELDPGCAEAWNELGLCSLRLAEITDTQECVEQAIRHFYQAIELRGGLGGNPDIEWLYNYGCALDVLGTFTEEDAYHRRAIEILTRVHTLKSDDIHVGYQLAIAWFHLGELAADLECYQHGLDLFHGIISQDPDFEIVWDEWGCILLHLAVLTEDPTLPNESSRYLEEAEEKLLRAVALGSREALYHLSWLYSYLGQFEVAVHFLRRAADQGALPPLDRILHDDWLQELRTTQEFREFLEDISNI